MIKTSNFEEIEDSKKWKKILCAQKEELILLK